MSARLENQYLSSQIKVCFFSLNAYPILSGRYTNGGDTIGGAELQQCFLGKELAKQNYSVSFIVFQNHIAEPEIIDNITIYKTIKKNNSFHGIRSYIRAFLSLWAVLTDANADYYYQRGADAMIGIVSLFCILKRKKFIFSIASDMDINGEFLRQFRLLPKIFYVFGLLTASTIIVQTQYQKSLMEIKFHRKCIVINSHYPSHPAMARASKQKVALWVSTMWPWKQPELFLHLAKSLPQWHFHMIGGPAKNKNMSRGDLDQYFRKLREEAGKISNLEFFGFVNPSKVNQFFANDAVFVNTSTFEGFPNTFLQAWDNCMPVVSMNVDPDGIIKTHKLGFHSKTFNQLVIDVDYLLKNENIRDDYGNNGREYLEKEHKMETVIHQYYEIFR